MTIQVTRMDLDGAGSPMALVSKILKAEPNLPLPIPIEDLARQLDIAEIRDLTTEGFEGGLVTDEARSSGFILVNRTARRGRRRFTIGHELGHFLLTHHRPPPGVPFQCSREDMRQWSGKDQTAAVKMEVEANEFAALILMPPPLWRVAMKDFRDPDLSQVLALAGRFDVSKEAASRTFAQYHDEAVAVVVVKDGIIDRIYRNSACFPWLCVRRGQAAPGFSRYQIPAAPSDQPTTLIEARAELWLQSDWGQRLPGLYEQVLFQQGGYALILLWAEPEQNEGDDEDSDADRTAKQRLQDRQARWQR